MKRKILKRSSFRKVPKEILRECGYHMEAFEEAGK